MSKFSLLNGVTVVILVTFGEMRLDFSVYNISKNYTKYANLGPTLICIKGASIPDRRGRIKLFTETLTSLPLRHPTSEIRNFVKYLISQLI